MAQCDFVELKSGANGTNGLTIESILPDGTTIPAAPANGGLLIAGRETATGIQRDVRVTAAGALVTSGTVTLAPGVATQYQDAAGALPRDVSFTPVVDYTAQYITTKLTGLTIGATVTWRLFYRYAAGAAFMTLIKEVTVVVPASGEADIYYDFNQVLRLASNPIRYTVTVSAGIGTANTILATDEG